MLYSEYDDKVATLEYAREAVLCRLFTLAMTLCNGWGNFWAYRLHFRARCVSRERRKLQHRLRVSATKSYIIEHAKVFQGSLWQSNTKQMAFASSLPPSRLSTWLSSIKPMPSVSSPQPSTKPMAFVSSLQPSSQPLNHFDKMKAEEQLGAEIRGIPGLAYGLLIRRPEMSSMEDKCAYTYTQYCTKCRKMMRHCVSCSDDGAGSRCPSCNMHQRSGPADE